MLQGMAFWGKFLMGLSHRVGRRERGGMCGCFVSPGYLVVKVPPFLFMEGAGPRAGPVVRGGAEALAGEGRDV